MKAKDVILQNVSMSDMIVEKYLDDLSDADLQVRPVPGMNPIAWQVGHLISSERRFVEMVRPGTSPPLPEGFDERHARESTGAEDRPGLLSKARYLELWRAQRAATRAAIEAASDEDLDRTDPSFPPFASSAGLLLNMAGGHTLMHVGQWVAVRRKLGKPIAI